MQEVWRKKKKRREEAHRRRKKDRESRRRQEQLYEKDYFSCSCITRLQMLLLSFTLGLLTM